ncbi:hypothetical protein Q5P01_006082 [Channa striata]|uniref:Uncharacterized protein n=1 Tax=Channa striata TaxID=64152 RepID=A0AA88NC82_CHASR|nr:hypothetical protein Q5P01_006082 [Channa striata]
MEVVPKVLQGFWLPPSNTCFNMHFKQLSKMAVGATKTVQDQVPIALSTLLLPVPFSQSIKDEMILSSQEKVEQGYAQHVLVKILFQQMCCDHQ